VLASSAKGAELKKYKQIAHIDDLTQYETSSDDVDRSKPSPDVIEKAMATLNNPLPETVIMVGDTPWDMIAASTAEVQSIGVLCGGFPESELRSAGAIAIYRDPADLLAQFRHSALSDKEVRAA